MECTLAELLGIGIIAQALAEDMAFAGLDRHASRYPVRLHAV